MGDVENSTDGRELFHIAGRRWFGQPAAKTHPHLIQTGEVTPGITKEEYTHRRHKLLQKITTSTPNKSDNCNHIVIIPSATKVYMSHDIPYVFRQNSDFLYLCGFQEPDSVLVLESNGSSLQGHRALLFVPRKDPHKELWEGSRSGKDGAVELTGVDYAENMDAFPKYLDALKKSNKNSHLWYNYNKPSHMIFHIKYIGEFLQQSRHKIENPTTIIQSLRAIKSEAEMVIMAESNKIASESFIEVMKFSRPEINEAHLYARMDYECRIRGAEYLAYPPVVAGGNRANTIHYINNNQIVEDGEMVLMDAGCEYHGYTSDITRTWPVSGEFSPYQRALYDVVLDVQQWCIEQCANSHNTLNTIFEGMLTRLGLSLKELGLLGNVQGAELQRLSREYCPHHVGHYLGMDVHDTDEMSRSLPLQPGMIITIEPGIYIPNGRTDVPEEFWGQGIRIEDNILITDSGYINLTKHCPKDPVKIQNIVKSTNVV